MSKSPTIRVAFVAVLSSLGSVPSFGDLIRGFETQTINTVSSGQQIEPSVGVDADGGFVVVWQDDSDENGRFQIHARGFHADGSRAFEELTVNTLSSGQQIEPQVGVDADGDFVAVWADDSDQNGIYQIRARGFHADGSEAFGEFTVNTVDSGQQRKPVVGTAASGTFVVAWQDDSDHNGVFQVRARGFHADGSPAFGEFTVNTVSSGQQLAPAVGMDVDGNFVAAWEDDSDENGTFQIRARGFHADGTQSFGEFTVNTVSSGQQLAPAVGVDAEGDFVVAWMDDANQNLIFQIRARGFHAGGTEAVEQFTVNSDAAGQQIRPASGESSGTGTAQDPCKKILLKPTGIEISCKGEGVTLAPPVADELAFVLDLGEPSVGARYCAQFGGRTLRNDAKSLKRKDAPPPTACAEPGEAPVLSVPPSSTGEFTAAMSYPWPSIATNLDHYELEESTSSPTSAFSVIHTWFGHQSPHLVALERPGGTYYYRVRVYVGLDPSPHSEVKQHVVTQAPRAVLLRNQSVTGRNLNAVVQFKVAPTRQGVFTRADLLTSDSVECHTLPGEEVAVGESRVFEILDRPDYFVFIGFGTWEPSTPTCPFRKRTFFTDPQFYIHYVWQVIQVSDHNDGEWVWTLTGDYLNGTLVVTPQGSPPIYFAVTSSDPIP